MIETTDVKICRFGEWLKISLTKKKMRQKHLAEELGVSDACITH